MSYIANNCRFWTLYKSLRRTAELGSFSFICWWIILAPPPRFARSNRKTTQKGCRLEEKKHSGGRNHLGVLASPQQIHCWALNLTDLPLVTRLYASYTWQISEHVFLIELKWAYLPQKRERETDGRGEYSIWADDYSKPLAIRVCDTDIYVMWHRCGNGSCRRRFASSAACCSLLFSLPRQWTCRWGGKSPCGLLLLHFVASVINKALWRSTTCRDRAGFLCALACFLSTSAHWPSVSLVCILLRRISKWMKCVEVTVSFTTSSGSDQWPQCCQTLKLPDVQL